MKELGISQSELGSLEGVVDDDDIVVVVVVVVDETLLWKYVMFFELEDELISEEVEFCNRSLLLLGALTDSEVPFGKISWVQLLFTKMVFDTSRGIMKIIRNEKYHATKTTRVTKTGCRIQLEYLHNKDAASTNANRTSVMKRVYAIWVQNILFKHFSCRSESSKY